MKFFIKTYGCQMNVRDSEAMASQLIASGFEQVTDENQAELLLFNTCSVRDAAERKAKGKVFEVQKLKEKRDGVIIGIVGCMAQRMGDQLLKELPHVDFVLGTGQLHKLPGIVNKLRSEHQRISETAESADVLTELGQHLPTGTPFAQIAITRGCNRFCSYCIVPYVRGREISRSQEDIVSEAQKLVDSGVREILLLGQNVAAYGLNGNINPPPPGYSPFGELLEKLNAIDGLYRIRYTSPYVTYFNDRLIEALCKCEKVCHNIHLPLQSGSDRILKAMNRQYTAASYREYAAKLRAAIPDLTFSTDVIVGFPGETEEDFQMTRELMNEIGYSQSYIFKYSPRPGAKSAAMPDSVPEFVKEERNQILLKDLASRVEKMLEQMVGNEYEILVEGESSRNADRWSGRTGTNFLVHFEPEKGIRPGVLRKVKILRAGGVSLLGELV